MTQAQSMSQRPGYSLMVCPDQEMLRRRLERLTSIEGGGFTRQVFWGDADDFGPAFWQALATVSLFSEPKIVVLRRAEGLPAEFWEKLSRPLAGFNEHVWPVICLEGPHDAKKGPSLPKGLADRPYWKVGLKKGWVWQSPGLNQDTLLPMLKDWAQGHRLRFSQGVLGELAQMLPLDMTACARELEKLELAVDGGEVRREHLAVVSFHEELDMFAFLKAIEAGQNHSDVWDKVFKQQLSTDDAFVFQFLAVLLREARQMWQLLHEDSEFSGHPYVRKIKTPMAQQLGRARLARMWDLAMTVESAIKSGERSPDQALEALVADLYALFGRGKDRF